MTAIALSLVLIGACVVDVVVWLIVYRRLLGQYGTLATRSSARIEANLAVITTNVAVTTALVLLALARVVMR
jgi:hypothetical protein